mmetsp:Transcript_94765/g.289934  ORF Transcript_94765/g.289934 Transcript_94765/m.289934 type:complete len:252 (-) Transcript_94765:586-1341(-)
MASSFPSLASTSTWPTWLPSSYQRCATRGRTRPGPSSRPGGSTCWTSRTSPGWNRTSTRWRRSSRSPCGARTAGPRCWPRPATLGGSASERTGSCWPLGSARTRVSRPSWPATSAGSAAGRSWLRRRRAWASGRKVLWRPRTLPARPAWSGRPRLWRRACPTPSPATRTPPRWSCTSSACLRSPTACTCRCSASSWTDLCSRRCGPRGSSGTSSSDTCPGTTRSWRSASSCRASARRPIPSRRWPRKPCGN